MSADTFLRLDADGETASWLTFAADGSIAANGHGPLDDVAKSILGERVVVVAPGEALLLIQAAVPGINKRLLAQAVPYVLEENLAADVETLHFAFGAIKDEQVTVAVIDRERMDQWLERLSGATINAKALVPDILLLPWQEGEWSVACFDGRCIVRNGLQSGQVLEPENCAAILKIMVAEAGDAKPQRIHVFSAEGFEIALDDVVVEQQTFPGPLLPWLAKHHDERQSLNLLQGPYSRRERMGQYWRPWRLVASLAAVWLLAQLVIGIADYQTYSSERTALKKEIDSIYLKTFPDARKVVNAKVQMERRLKALRGGGSSRGGSGFTDLLALAGTHFKDVKKLTLQRVSYKDGMLDVSLTIGDLQQLDALKQKLTADGKLQVDIQSASAQGAGVEARLRIKGRVS